MKVIVMTNPKPVVDYKKECTKAKHKNGKLQGEIDSLKYQLQQLQVKYDYDHRRLKKYEDIMEFVAEEMSQYFGLIMRKEVKEDSRDW